MVSPTLSTALAHAYARSPRVSPSESRAPTRAYDTGMFGHGVDVLHSIACVVTSAGPGLRWNLATRVGLERKAHPQLAFAAEGFVYRSRFALQRIDEDRAPSTTRAVGGEMRAVYTC